jgi:hypothetical protein
MVVILAQAVMTALAILSAFICGIAGFRWAKEYSDPKFAWLGLILFVLFMIMAVIMAPIGL